MVIFGAFPERSTKLCFLLSICCRHSGSQSAQRCSYRKDLVCAAEAKKCAQTHRNAVQCVQAVLFITCVLPLYVRNRIAWCPVRIPMTYKQVC